MKEYICNVIEQMETPIPFSNFHRAIKAPYNFHQLTLSLFEPLIDYKHSKLLGKENLSKMEAQLKKGENVILLSNHQSEADPQLMTLTLRKMYPTLVSRFIFVAGHRVTQDILAVPLSLGLNLLCIYSKNYINSPLDQRAKKQSHNQSTIKEMKRLLQKGGSCIYVACSGGRDRKKEDGSLEPAPFDPDSVELFSLIANRARTPTHFYPLAMHTYEILPPPKERVYALGETRVFYHAPAHFYFGEEIDLTNLHQDISDKKERRNTRAQTIWERVKSQYNELTHD